jgi:pre-mRNA-splicing factor ATP-dependent RNA helicase DHX15/PRP43
MLSVPSVWIRPSNQRREADAAKQMFTIPESDHLTLLNVYNQYILSELLLSSRFSLPLIGFKRQI